MAVNVDSIDVHAGETDEIIETRLNSSDVRAVAVVVEEVVQSSRLIFRRIESKEPQIYFQYRKFQAALHYQ